MVKSSYIGKKAEEAVAKELFNLGHKIIAQNWRRPRCEIDLISSLDQTIFFTEVKYRSSSGQGEGFDYVTPAKHRQMELAAQIWLQENVWQGECQLLAASVSGQNYSKIDIIEI